jgi:hypothetical protein
MIFGTKCLCEVVVLFLPHFLPVEFFFCQLPYITFGAILNPVAMAFSLSLSMILVY